MINLASRPDADNVIREELERCGIPAVSHNGPGEVPYTIRGELNGMTFTRAWYYYMVDCKVPLDVALRMWDYSSVVRKDVRVAGHCGCEHPTKWASWLTPDGKEVIAASQLAEFEKLKPSMGDNWMKDAHEKYIFSDFPASHGAHQFCTHYHIDSELGLYIFVQFMTGAHDVQ